MATEANNKKEKALKELKECCELIKAKAKESSLSDRTLLAHLQKAIYDFKWKGMQKKTKADESSGLLDYLLLMGKITMYILFGLIVIYLVVGAACAASPSLRRKATVITQDYHLVYHYLRVVRLLTLPLHKLIDLRTFSPAECFINNPFYVQEPIPCDGCINATEIERLTFDNDEIADAIQEFEPIVITGEPAYSNVTYDYDYLRNFYKENQEEIEGSFVRSFGTTSLKRPGELFALTKDELLKTDYVFGWHASHLLGTRTLRKLYGRPTFLPTMAEIVIEKTVTVMSPNTESNFSMPLPSANQGLIVQASGESLVSLVPFEDCATNCTTLEVTLQQGEIFCVPSSPWDIVVKPVGNAISILYTAGFTAS